MKAMHWNYWEYNHTPASVVEEIWAWIKTDRQMQEEAAERGTAKKRR
jgi:hypothetical protein